MKSLLLLAAAAVIGATSAQAADMAVRKAPVMVAAPSWAGVYLGASVGARWANVTANAIIPGGGVDSASYDSTSLRGGGYVGANFMLGNAWVVGIEGDIAYGDATTSRAFVVGSGPVVPGDASSVNQRWDASIRGRAGWLATPSLLLYVTGGVAWQQIDATATLAGFGTASARDTRAGWTIGGGVETMLGGNWLARAEYRYADFGTSRMTFVFPAGIGQTDYRLATHTALVGIAYKF